MLGWRVTLLCLVIYTQGDSFAMDPGTSLHNTTDISQAISYLARKNKKVYIYLLRAIVPTFY